MKTLTITALVTGLLVLPFFLRRRKVSLSTLSEDDIRYDVDDCITE